MKELEAAMDKEVALLLDKGVTLEELKGARTRMLASFTWYRDSLQGPAMLFGRALASGLGLDYIENRSQRIESLTIDDINDAADKVFKGDDLPVTGILLPQQKPPAEKKEGSKP